MSQSNAGCYTNPRISVTSQNKKFTSYLGSSPMRVLLVGCGVCGKGSAQSSHSGTQGDKGPAIFSMWLLRICLVPTHSWQKGKDRRHKALCVPSAWKWHTLFPLIFHQLDQSHDPTQRQADLEDGVPGWDASSQGQFYTSEEKRDL